MTARMTAAPESRQASWSWMALAATLATAAWLVATLAGTTSHTSPGNTLHALDLQPSLGLSQPWRWLTAAWVHWGTTHMTINIIGAGALAWLGWAACMSRAAALAWLIAWPLTQLLLLGLMGMGPDAWAALGFSPNVANALTTVPAHYGGLSGVLHAGASIVALWLILTNHDIKRWAGGLLLAVLVAKLGWELAHPARLLGVLGDGSSITSVSAAHVAGVLAGLLCAVFVLGVLEAGRGPAAASHRALDSVL
jgi:hypothetical protein